ncbi:hypothetical protein Dsin_021406 [Dipteronia sinensis]|uniref:Receptor-like serine/threonine-protein kinase n=1 Tax=Dipteronia sinensis TaxID=43782 RepID=A0AAE0A141_9ROSI|nr:hypothetical protein Dsin_021406 [Dipteronia sinensis]
MSNRSKNICKIFVHIISFCFWAHAAATDILNQGDMLRSSDSRVSRNGVFTLRFYNLSMNNWYLSIWYKYDPTKPCWLANRDRPIKNNSGVLLIDEQGNLMMTYTGGVPIKLYSGQSAANINVTAVLQDDGNFVLKKSADDSTGGVTEQILWQSFDSPTDCFLPGMKLGINLKTSQNWSLTSWLTSSVPTRGAFTLEWVPSEHQMILRRRGVKFWSSGVLNKDAFGNLTVSSDIYDFIYSEHSNNHEQYLTYNLVALPSIEEWDNVSSLTLGHDGRITRWSSRRVGFTKVDCDGLRTDSGCERWERPECRSHGEKMERREIYYDNSVVHFEDKNESRSFSDCVDICWNDCTCFGVSNIGNNSVNPGCIFWYGPLKETATGEKGTTCYIIISAPPPKFRGVIMILVIAVAAAIVIGTVLIIFFYFFMRWRRARVEEKFLFELMNEAKELEIEGKKGFKLKVYSVASIMDATNCFSDENKLGEGGYGPVYKGLFDGQEIAIKRLSRSSRQGLVEFKNELIIVAKLQHTNLVQLLGFCIQGEEKMIVYEYMPNKSLDSYIFDQSKRRLFHWNKYFNIIEEIAQGLLYLHKYSRLRIIHRDLKASNILLDKNLSPKISDFGMAKTFTTTQFEANTNRIVGTRGYMPPEYTGRGIFSTKVDVFSFGVLVLEIVSGRRSNSNFNFVRPLNLIGYAWMLWKEDAALELIHPTLRDSCSEDQVLRCINVALLCAEDNPLDRPSMADVISMLTSEGVKLPMPKQPAFCIERRVAEVNSNEDMVAENHSINNVTISVIDGR